jgi:hypothetical protein
MADFDPYAPVANALVAAITAEFTPEQITADHDQLHEALGVDGPVCGVAPLREVPVANTRVAQHTLIQIQFFDVWEKEIDPTQQVDPRIITGHHARMMRVVREVVVPIGDSHWFLQWEGTEYPRDPTGNNSRFVMVVRAWSTNSALVETTD